MIWWNIAEVPLPPEDIQVLFCRRYRGQSTAWVGRSSFNSGVATHWAHIAELPE